MAGDRPSLAELLASRFARNEARAPGMWFSMAGEDCARRVYYKLTSTPHEPEPLERRLVMEFGTAFDAHALRPGEGVAVQVPTRLEVSGLTVTGRADVVFMDGEQPHHVADLKLVGASTWERLEKAPKQEHRAQVNLYAYALGAATWSVCYVLREKTETHEAGEIREHHGELDTFAARRDLGLFEEVAYWLAKGEAPPRPYADREDEETGRVTRARDAFPCGWCSFQPTCWAEETTE